MRLKVEDSTTLIFVLVMDVIRSSNSVSEARWPNSNDVSLDRLQINNQTINRYDLGRGRGMMDHDYEMAEMKSKSNPWLSYYDFLITEGSYKFWVVFQLFTVVVLVYSAFAAIYYAKYTFSDVDLADYGDYFFKRSGVVAEAPVSPTQSTFLGLSPDTYMRIINAVANYNKRYS